MTFQVEKSRRRFFTASLLRWHESHHRPLPWKGEKDPYLIWLSEIILQQTRVEQGLSYFLKFKEKYPDVKALASAPEDEIMKMWEGLGYYSRARNMHAAAKVIANELGGVFPLTHEGIRQLKGVGEYTASAIASFAFDLPHAVVDGNVYRVLSRFFGIGEPVDTTAGKKLFAGLARKLLDCSQPGKYNQAIMDFGAAQCTPKAPDCGSCPMNPHCVAYKTNRAGEFPVKSKRLIRKERFFNYVVIQNSRGVFIHKRVGKDIWQNLYEFPMIETGKLPGSFQELQQSEKWKSWLNKQEFKFQGVSEPYTQVLTHQSINALFWEFSALEHFEISEDKWWECPISNLKMYAFPRVIVKYLKKKSLPLELA